jgi:hypothetical protein
MTGESSNSAGVREVASLDGDDLALWVARAASHDIEAWGVFDGKDKCYLGHIGGSIQSFAPHADWAQGGPIIERANIHLSPPTSPVHRFGGPNAGNGPSGHWSACTWHRGADGHRSFGWHETSPLIAAMRCFVRSVYGKTVSGAQP